jgi:hypothetical protein
MPPIKTSNSKLQTFFGVGADFQPADPFDTPSIEIIDTPWMAALASRFINDVLMDIKLPRGVEKCCLKFW